MAQADYIISNQTFPNTRADINSHLQAIATNNSGTSAPTTQYAGQFWIDTTSSTWTLYIHDGSDDIQFATIDTSANTVNFTDSALDVVTDTTPQLGGNLDLNSNDITGTGNINITGTIESSGNITGTLATASQPNITSVGTLSSLNVDASAGTGVIGITLDNGTVTTSKDSASFRSQLSMYNTTGQVAKFDTANDDLFLRFADDLAFQSMAGSEYMRIDSSGNLLVGGTETTLYNDTTGTQLCYRNGSSLDIKREGTPLNVNRTVSDGALVTFFSSGTEVGSIGTVSGTVNFGQSDTALVYDSGNDQIRPYSIGSGTRDNAIDLGSSSGRFKDLYLGGGLYVGGTASANKLDDYEEGTFIPTLTPSTSGSLTINNSANELKYTKIGNTVFVQGRLEITGSSSPVGSNLNLGNMPFTPVSSSEGSGWFGGMCAISNDGSATFQPFTVWALTTTVKITTTIVASMGSNTRLHFNFFYETS